MVKQFMKNNMQELIKEWREFYQMRKDAEIVNENGDSYALYPDKPDFCDFMRWLSDKYK